MTIIVVRLLGGFPAGAEIDGLDRSLARSRLVGVHWFPVVTRPVTFVVATAPNPPCTTPLERL
jgi:hypothetical protein